MFTKIDTKTIDYQSQNHVREGGEVKGVAFVNALGVFNKKEVSPKVNRVGDASEWVPKRAKHRKGFFPTIARAMLMPSILLAVTALTGCFTVKNTEGLRMALEDQAHGEVLAYELKESYPDPDTREHIELRALYNNAFGATNGFLNAIHANAALTYRVDVSKDTYFQHEASEKWREFFQAGEAMRPRGAVSFEIIAHSVLSSWLDSGIRAVADLQKERRNEGVRRLEQLIESYRSVPFDLIDEEYMRNRYSQTQRKDQSSSDKP